MSTTTGRLHQTWTRDNYLISIDPSLIDLSALTAAFAEPWMYWAKALPMDAMKIMVDNSLCFGLYSMASTSSPTESSVARTSTPCSLIGFARLITDKCTFAYLTDVYVLPIHQGAGLGAWLVACVQSYLESLPHLRRSMLVTGRDGPNIGFYERRMKMEKLEGGALVPMSWVGPGWGGGRETEANDD